MHEINCIMCWEVTLTGRSSTPQDVKLDQKVLEMLQRLDLMEHEEVFKEQDLSLSDIAELDQEALKSLGIRLVKHRTAIIKYTSGKYKN